MHNSAAKIQCLNHNCQAFNSQKNDFCHKCRTPIVKRYLWTIGEKITAYKVGELIGNRYLSIQQRVVLDTKPGLTPQVPEKIPQKILPYLQLFPYRLHVPQVYGYILDPDDEQATEVWLLEYGTVPTNNVGELKDAELLPKLTQVWQEATALRQLNWLWQIAKLWEPLQSKRLLSSLLNPSLLRVNGAIVQLLELDFDEDKSPNLSHLGQLWQEWAFNSSPNNQKLIKEIGQNLEKGKIRTPNQLIDILDKAISHIGRSQQRKYQVFALTDSGPSRSHNEDSCYPTSGKLIENDVSDGKALAIVCDGIGGHAGGEIASQLAIDSLQTIIEQLPSDSDCLSPAEAISHLTDLTCVANDLISERNDSEKRHERQRMGTTLVMSLAYAHQMYLTHVGDSRIYWISATGCHQVTVDDDLASREVQLGYAFYRDIVEFPHSGALVQALGMESSASLNPTVERLILDEDCVFLLCSDGLSDYGRVEQYWKSQILPILYHQVDIATVGQRLIQIANRENGHDNVTIALVYCQVESADSSEAEINLSLSQIISSLPSPSSSVGKNTLKISSNTNENEEMRSGKSSPRLWPLISIILIFLGLGVVSYLFPQLTNQIIDAFKPDRRPPITKVPVPPAKVTLEPNFQIGEAIEIQEAIPLWSIPAKTTSNQQPVGQVPEGSVLKILEKESNSPWLQLQVCQVPPDNYPTSVKQNTPTLLAAGKTGWIQAEAIEKRIHKKYDPKQNLDKCISLPTITKQPSVKIQK
jgi:protein phosphatase